MCAAIKGIREESLEEGIKESLEEGIKEGLEEGQKLFSSLVRCLIADNKYDELKKASEDFEFSRKLMIHYGIISA